MKKYIIASGVAVLAFATLVSAATFNTNLTVGSRGADVTALQTWLIGAGYSVPAGATGYFGSQTKAAVIAFQTAKSLPTTGFVGPLTRAILNGGSSVVVNNPVVNNPVTGVPSSISTPGVVGTLAVSLWSTPSGIVAYKGQSYDVASYKVQASASDMSIQNLTLDFDVRLWLYASAVTIKDDSGMVVGQVSNLGQGNFSELTVGSQYRLSVPVNGYVVRATQTKYLTVNVSFLPTSDRASGTVNVLQAQVRSVDGTGVTDTQTSTGGSRPFSYQGNGAGSIIVTTDSASPSTGLVQLSTSAQTQGVTLAIFDVKSQNAPSTLRSLSLVVKTAGSATVQSLFNNIKVTVGGLTYSANSIAANASAAGFSSSTVVFNNMTVPLAADTYVPVKVTADVAVDTNNTLDGTVSSTTWSVVGINGGGSNNPVVEDQSFNTLAINTANFTSNALTFTGSSVTVVPTPVTNSSYGQAMNNTTTGSTTQSFRLVFSATAGNNPIYLSKTTFTALSVTNNTGSTVTAQDFSDNDTSGDGTTFFYLAPGQTKTFTASFSASGLTTTGGGTFYVTSINYGTTTTATGASLNQSNIQNTLKATLWN